MREGEPHSEEKPKSEADILWEKTMKGIENSGVENNPNPSPFLTGKILKGGDFGIREITDNPDKIVRTDSMVGSVEQTMTHYKNIKDRFEAMRDDYGINIPDITDISVGKNEQGKDCVFMVVDKIDGKDLGELKSLPETEKDNFENFYTKFLQSIFDAYKNEKPFFCDIKTGNIMYGHKSKEPNAKDDFFLSDVGGGGFNENGFIEFQGQHIEVDYNQGFFRSMINAKSDLEKYERMFGEDTELETIRLKLESIFAYCTSNKKQELETFIAKDPTVQELFK